MSRQTPDTAAYFAALIADARADREAPIDRDIPLDTIRAETKNGKTRLVGINVRTEREVRLSVWQPTEEQAVHDAIARAFC